MDPYATHLVPLIRAVMRTHGPVLECGAGLYSTPILRELCGDNRRLVSSESDRAWFDRIHSLYPDRSTSQVLWRTNNLWNDMRINAMRWSVAFVDCLPTLARVPLIERLRGHIDVILAHDFDMSADHYYRWSTMKSFEYQWVYVVPDGGPSTGVFSDTVDVERLMT